MRADRRRGHFRELGCDHARDDSRKQLTAAQTRRVDEESLWKMQNTGEALRCWKNRSNAALRGCSRSERAQQDRADERKHGEHRQHVEPQRKIHVMSSHAFCFGAQI